MIHKYKLLDLNIVMDIYSGAVHVVDDIVYDMLVKNGINFIDESNLLSFLVINHLVSKVIPKELFDSKILNYADGYFKIA